MSGYAVALGMFDSVHIGHRAVITETVKNSQKSVAITFDELPTKDKKTLLTTEERKQKLLSAGVSEVWVLCFNEVKNLTPNEFLEYLKGRGEIEKICSGFNFKFGKNAEGDTKFLKSFAEKNNIQFIEVPKIEVNGETVSTSHIKKLLAKGEIDRANSLLGCNFSFSAEVVRGDTRGRKLGFPTINQIYPENKTELKFGVYHTRVCIGGKIYDGVTNFGIRPTFKNNFVSAETHIIDYSGDLYGKTIELSFVEYIRDERKFNNIEELIKEVNDNILYVKKKHQ